MGTTPNASSGSSAALNDRLEQLQQRLRAELRRTSRATTSVIVLGVLLLLLLGGYFAYGYSVIKKETAQEPLLDFAEATLQDQLPAGLLVADLHVLQPAELREEAVLQFLQLAALPGQGRP